MANRCNYRCPQCHDGRGVAARAKRAGSVWSVEGGPGPIDNDNFAPLG